MKHSCYSLDFASEPDRIFWRVRWPGPLNAPNTFVCWQYLGNSRIVNAGLVQNSDLLTSKYANKEVPVTGLSASHRGTWIR